ncbi:MAG: hypothetical protein WCF03_05760 [Nitrososphaeraceae archaeon]
MHPRDPQQALKQQIEMISELKDQDNMMPLYKDLIPKLRDYKIPSACP